MIFGGAIRLKPAEMQDKSANTGREAVNRKNGREN